MNPLTFKIFIKLCSNFKIVEWFGCTWICSCTDYTSLKTKEKLGYRQLFCSQWLDPLLYAEINFKNLDIVNLTDDEFITDDPRFDLSKMVLEFLGLDMFVSSNQNINEVSFPFTYSDLKENPKSWQVCDAGVPKVMFYGFGDACANSGMKQIDQTFE